MSAPNHDYAPLASPEWATAARADRALTEGVTGGWRVSAAPIARGMAYTDFANHVMAVPEGDSLLARGIRTHELMHSRFSPVSVPPALLDQLELPPVTVRAVEELRLMLIGMGSSVFTAPGMDTHDAEILGKSLECLTDGTETRAAKHIAEANDWRGAVLLMVSTWGTDVYKSVRRTLAARQEWRDRLTSTNRYLKRHYPIRAPWNRRATVSGTYPVAWTWKDRYALEEVVLPEGFQWTLTNALHIEQLIQDGERRAGRGEGRFDGDDQEELEEDPQRHISQSRWASPRLGLTSLTEPTSHFLGRRRRPSITGKYPTRPDRLLTDPERRIFREEVRGGGGVVLFDCSGSMRVNYEAVRETAQMFAGCTILAYSYTANPELPNLWVLAKNGMMIDAENMEQLDLNRGNGIDGPALRYALRFRKSRKDFVLWVSDCGVTGTDDDWGDDLLTDCANIVLRNGIIQAQDHHRARSLLATIKRDGTAPRNYWESPLLIDRMTKIALGKLAVPIVGIDPKS